MKKSKKEKIKFYDKNIYKVSEKLKFVTVILCSFTIGFIIGYFVEF